MGDQTTTQNGPRIEVPVTQTPEEIYDAIMVPIEPELASDLLPLLAEKYKNETPEEKKTRGQRYEKAFQEYEKKSKEYHIALKAKIRSFQVDAMRSLEADKRIEEEQELISLEATFSAAD